MLSRDLQAPVPELGEGWSLPPGGAREQVCNSFKNINVIDIND